MSFLRRSFSGKRLKYEEFTVTGSGGTLPTPPECAEVTISGYKGSGIVGTISPGVFRGYTITDLDAELDYVLNPELNPPTGACEIAGTESVYFTITGYTGPKELVSYIQFMDGFLDPILSVNDAFYNGGGTWLWSGILNTFSNGTIRVYYNS